MFGSVALIVLLWPGSTTMTGPDPFGRGFDRWDVLAFGGAVDLRWVDFGCVEGGWVAGVRCAGVRRADVVIVVLLLGAGGGVVLGRVVRACETLDADDCAEPLDPAPQAASPRTAHVMTTSHVPTRDLLLATLRCTRPR